MKPVTITLVILLTLPATGYGYEKGLIKLESWKTMRDKGVVKQEKDDSCGAAALATVLLMYGTNVSEEEILKEAGKEGWLSFEDIRKSAIKREYRAAGFAGDIELLRQLKYPVIVFLRPEKGAEHFSVFYKIDDKRVYLADPFFGKIGMEIPRFEQIWHTRSEKLQGSLLLILPKKGEEALFKPLDVQKSFLANQVAVRDMLLRQTVSYQKTRQSQNPR
jgi:hypothetical protein